MVCLFTSRLDRNLRLCHFGCCECLGLNWSNVQCVDICFFGLLVVCCFTSSCHHSSLITHLIDRLPETHRQCCSNRVQHSLIHSAIFALPLLIFLARYSTYSTSRGEHMQMIGFIRASAFLLFVVASIASIESTDGFSTSASQSSTSNLQSTTPSTTSTALHVNTF